MKPLLLFRNPKTVKGVGIAFIVAFGLFIAYQIIFQLPEAVKAEAELKREFALLDPLPGAVLIESASSHKTGQALVTAYYDSSETPQEIFGYFDNALGEQGWKYYQMEGVRDWNRDLGGWSATWCKGEYSADLQYAGESANYGWTFAFGMALGLHDCEPRIPFGSGGIVRHNIIDSLFLFLSTSAFCFIFLNLAFNAWSMTADEYQRWRQQLGYINLFRHSNSYLLWNDRIVGSIGALLTFAVAIIGLVMLISSLWI